MAFSVTYTDPRDLDDRQLLLLILERLDTMSAQADAAAAAETALSAKVDQLLAAFAAGKTQVADLQAQITALQAQITTLQTNGVLSATDAAELTAATVDMSAKAAAIDTALTPTVAP